MRAVAILPVYVGGVYFRAGDELDYNGEPCAAIKLLPEPTPEPKIESLAEPPAPAPTPRRRARE